jgi:hypothetical protein
MFIVVSGATRMFSLREITDAMAMQKMSTAANEPTTINQQLTTDH